jgi:cell division protein FtsA
MAAKSNNSAPAFVGIDIGSSKVTCVIGVSEESSPSPSIIGVGKSNNTGMRKGQVVDIEDTMQAITNAVDEAERISGYAVDSATIGIGGVNIVSLNSKGVIAVGGMDKEITIEDVHRVEDAATVVQLPPNREILQVFPRNYRLDGQDNIKDPVGMSGVRLEVDAHIITISTPALKNIERSLAQTGVKSNQFVVSTLASAGIVLDKKQKENGTAIIDIGSATTGVAIYEEGEILHTAILPVGSGHITNDLAIGLKTDLDTAEEIKRDFSNVAAKDKSAKLHKIKEHDSKEEKEVKQKDIDLIVSARLEELFRLVDKELKKVHRSGKLPGGVVLVGGGANLNGINKVAKKILQLNAKVAKPENFSGIIDAAGSPEFSNAVGLMLDDMMSVGDGREGWGINSSISKGTSTLRSLFDRFRP